MSIGKLCTREVVCMKIAESVAAASRLMRDHHVGSVVIVEEATGVRPIGMVTDRDIVVGVVAQGLDPECTPIGSLMRADLACIGEDEEVGRALQLMRSKGVRRLPVTDASGELVGLIAVDDLLDVFAEEMSAYSGMLTSEQARERATPRAAAKR
jgi:CBS domain-containing protein